MNYGKLFIVFLVSLFLMYQSSPIDFAVDNNLNSLKKISIKQSIRETTEISCDSRGIHCIGDGWNMLHWAVYHKNREMIKYLIKQGVDLEHKENEFGWTPIFISVIPTCNVSLLNDLINYGANYSVIDKYGGNLLTRSAKRNDLSCFIYLLKKGMNVEHRHTNGDNSWSSLATNKDANFDIFKNIDISKYCDAVLTREQSGHTALDIAMIYKNYNFLKIFKFCGKPSSPPPHPK